MTRSNRRPNRTLVAAAQLSGSAERYAAGRATDEEVLAEMAGILNALPEGERQLALDSAVARYLRPPEHPDEAEHQRACADLLLRAGARRA